MVYVKVCGLTSVQDAQVAVEAGADAIGLVMSAGRPRRLTEEAASRITAAVRDEVDTVLVVAGLPAAEAAAVAERLGVHVLQLRGPAHTRADFGAARERIGRVWRAVALADDPGCEVGTRPHGVDVSSGVESSPGVKDHDKIRAFVARARIAAPAWPENCWGTDESTPCPGHNVRRMPVAHAAQPLREGPVCRRARSAAYGTMSARCGGTLASARWWTRPPAPQAVEPT